MEGLRLIPGTLFNGLIPYWAFAYAKKANIPCLALSYVIADDFIKILYSVSPLKGGESKRIDEKLGRVHTFERFNDECEADEEGEHHIQLVEPRKDAAESLQSAKEPAPLHCVSYTSLGRTATVHCDCSWEARQESLLNRGHIAVSPRPHRLGPSPRNRPTAESRPTTSVPRVHRRLGPATTKTLRRCKHPRQPDESWSSSLLGTSRWLAARFFSRARPVWMHFHYGTIQGYDLDLYAEDLLLL